MTTRTIPRNAGTLDRLLRGVLGIALLGLFGALRAPWSYAVAALGLAFIGTAATGFCPLYALLGCSTGKREGTSP
jgi:hypothetical protein